MRILYSLFLTLALIALLPYFAYQAIFKRKYLGNLRERLGRLPAELNADSRPVIWVHAVSVGEALSAVPLVKLLRNRFPQHRIVVSTTTMTGQSVARAQMGGRAGVALVNGFCYFPFDWKFSVRRALGVIRPQIIILMESELWLNFLDECKKRQIPVVVANGRISDRSFARSQKFGFFIQTLYGLVTRFVMQSAVDRERALELGAPPDRVVAGGNLKYDIGETGELSKIAETAESLGQKMGLGQGPLVVAGSTHEGEEQIALLALKELKASNGLTNIRLLIAPRHPERFDAVARLLDDSRLRYSRCSMPEMDREAEVVLLDSMGELAAVYSLASAVFVGGSLVPVGGHNVLEPALFAKPIIVGPHMHNFRDITEEFLRREALIQLRGTAERELQNALRIALSEVLGNQRYARSLGENARRAVEENRGATARTVEIIATLIS